MLIYVNGKNILRIYSGKVWPGEMFNKYIPIWFGEMIDSAMSFNGLVKLWWIKDDSTNFPPPNFLNILGVRGHLHNFQLLCEHTKSTLFANPRLPTTKLL